MQTTFPGKAPSIILGRTTANADMVLLQDAQPYQTIVDTLRPPSTPVPADRAPILHLFVDGFPSELSSFTVDLACIDEADYHVLNALLVNLDDSHNQDSVKAACLRHLRLISSLLLYDGVHRISRLHLLTHLQP